MVELHFQTSAYLIKHYDAILLPIFQTKDMAKESNTRNYRFNEGMLSLNHIRFRQLFQAKCAVSDKRLVFYSEMYTSQTCALCNRFHLKPGSKDVFDWAAWWYIFAGHFVIVALLAWNAAVNANERDRAVNKKLFALNYNEFHCNTHTLQMYTDGGESAVLLRLVTRDNTSISSKSSSASVTSSATLSLSKRLVWFHCRVLVITRVRYTKDLEGIFPTDRRMINKTTRAILKASTFSNTTDF